ncbi:MAG: hypothetical protein ABH871_00335, partial [Pseudomonadota bacterium]
MKWASRLIGISLCIAFGIVVTSCEKDKPLTVGEELGLEAGKAIYKVGGNVSGLSGSVVLQNNKGDDLTIMADGAFVFTALLADGA